MVELGRNSLTHSFAEAPLKAKMLRDYEAAVAAFETKFGGADWRAALRQGSSAGVRVRGKNLGIS